MPPCTAPEETGRTFAENARLKALHYAQAVPYLTVAEDSGLEIDDLDGEPGIHSARFNGATYAEKFNVIYAQVAGAPEPSPARARFVCAAGGGRAATASSSRQSGTIEGRVAESPGRRWRLRLRSHLLLSAVRLHAGRCFRRSQGGGEPPRARPSASCVSSSTSRGRSAIADSGSGKPGRRHPGSSCSKPVRRLDPTREPSHASAARYREHRPAAGTMSGFDGPIVQA